MADADLVTRTGKGASLSASDYDQNVNSLNGFAEEKTGTTYEVVYTDNGKTIELNNASMVCTLDLISDITTADDSGVNSFNVTLKNTNSADATVNVTSTDTFDDGSTSITLPQYSSVTLQIDSSVAIWNRIDEFNDTLTGKTINGGTVTLGTPQATTSGTEIDFTGIPSWVKKITLSYAGVSTDSTTSLVARIGDSGGFETTGYDSNVTVGQNSSNSSTVNATTYFHLSWGAAASRTHLGVSTFVLLDSSTNTWIQSGIDADTAAATAIMATTAGSKSLSGTLTQLRISTANGSETFDAGKINILYE